MAEITQLIDKFDTFEIVRDKIATILADETAMQVQLATNAGKPDPSLWNLRVYTERSIPWDKPTDGIVIVNVWFESAVVDRSASNPIRSQTMEGTFNIDVIGFADARTNGGGQISADEGAALNANRGLRLVRNILMASNYTYLGLRGLVGVRMPKGIESFQPPSQSQGTTHAAGMRLSLGVRYEEYSPQYEPEILLELGVIIERAEDGRVLSDVEYQYTP